MSFLPQSSSSDTPHPKDMKFPPQEHKTPPIATIPPRRRTRHRRTRTRNKKKTPNEPPQPEFPTNLSESSVNFNDDILSKIWHHALPKNNNVVIIAYIHNHSEGRYRFKSPNKPSPLLQVCRASRDIALSHYTASIGSRGSKRRIRFNSAQDKVLFQVEGDNRFIDLLVDSIAEESAFIQDFFNIRDPSIEEIGFATIQSLLVEEDLVRQLHWPEEIRAFFRIFCSLKDLGMAIEGNIYMTKKKPEAEDEGRAFAVNTPYGRVLNKLMNVNTPSRLNAFQVLRAVLSEVLSISSRPVLNLVRVSLTAKRPFGVGRISAGTREYDGISQDMTDNTNDYEMLFGIK
ncbi:hypothetical protein HYALB_00000896 [Hymenoscyphus albidus]|uniref:2EXR domain-containing protein n=1 Tax=Hymenoscyphus albidus TaxID=595503 RepID=A0A9N9LDY6_9HELO|nr:hypothetical protein HYALB_00000896 [Hymenoscyphus albidus]